LAQDAVAAAIAAGSQTGISISYNDVANSISFTNTDLGSSQNIFKNVAVAGQNTVVADSNNDTLTLVAGTNVTITTDDTTDAITINASGSGASEPSTQVVFGTGAGIDSSADLTFDDTTNILTCAGNIVAGGDLTTGDDIFLPSGGVINWDSGNVTITHASNYLEISDPIGVNGSNPAPTVYALHLGGAANYGGNAATGGFYDYQFFGTWSAYGSISPAGTTLAIGGYRASQWVATAIYGGGNLTQRNGSADVQFSVPIVPSANDGQAIGTTALQWSDLFLASGAIVNFDNGNATLTHSAALLTSNVDIVVPDDAYDATTWNGNLEVPTKNAIRDKIETLAAGSGITRTVTVTSGSATMGSSASTDYAYFVAGAHTMSLPAAAGNTNRYTVKNNHSASITVDTVGAETIDGTTSISINPGSSVDLLSDGTNWFVI
jgi:hypothetical protein